MSTKLTKRQKRALRKEGIDLVDSSNNGLFLKQISARTENQKEIFDKFNLNHLFVHGWPGTGKTYVLMYLAIKQVLNESSPYKKIKIFRSAVSTRNIGFLPGNVVAKMESFETPYIDITSDLFGRDDAYGILKHKGIIEFLPTSYIRGSTYNNCIVLVDECQNLNWHEFASLMTRCGKDCKFLFCGDSHQSDLTNSDKLDIHKMIEICNRMPSFDLINMEIDDIIRSGLVKEFIITANELNYRF